MCRLCTIVNDRKSYIRIKEYTVNICAFHSSCACMVLPPQRRDLLSPGLLSEDHRSFDPPTAQLSSLNYIYMIKTFVCFKKYRDYVNQTRSLEFGSKLGTDVGASAIRAASEVLT